VAEAAPTLASLTLDTDVPGASVFIDRQFVGNTPLTLDKLQPGTKRLQLTATGYDSVQKSVDLVAGPNAITVRIKEVSLNAKVPVVHKHGMGSCNGTLSATVDGLKYDTDNKGDAFTMSYAQAELFAVDYLQKNLRVKQKGGKTWNFTDKNDNADALFVFHREVEAARKKLYAQIRTIVRDEAPIAFVHYETLNYLMTKKVTGSQVTPTLELNMGRVGFTA